MLLIEIIDRPFISSIEGHRWQWILSSSPACVALMDALTASSDLEEMLSFFPGKKIEAKELLQPSLDF